MKKSKKDYSMYPAGFRDLRRLMDEEHARLDQEKKALINASSPKKMVKGD